MGVSVGVPVVGAPLPWMTVTCAEVTVAPTAVPSDGVALHTSDEPELLLRRDWVGPVPPNTTPPRAHEKTYVMGSASASLAVPSTHSATSEVVGAPGLIDTELRTGTELDTTTGALPAGVPRSVPSKGVVRQATVSPRPKFEEERVETGPPAGAPLTVHAKVHDTPSPSASVAVPAAHEAGESVNSTAGETVGGVPCGGVFWMTRVLLPIGEPLSIPSSGVARAMIESPRSKSDPERLLPNAPAIRPPFRSHCQETLTACPSRSEVPE